MVSVYVSSTYRDLKQYRDAVISALRRMNHHVVCMEQYGAEDRRPLDRCLHDVDQCDVYVGIFAWLYGYAPQEDNPAGRSITELEYRRACDSKKQCLIFLLEDDHPEQALPANGETQAYTFDEAIAPFKIQSQGSSNFLVKLADVNTGSTVMTIFVRGGQDVETLVPLGSYYVKYASGTTWYGYDHLFGDYHTGYSKADEVFNFSVDGDTVRGFSITLYAVEGGNLTTSGITASEF